MKELFSKFKKMIKYLNKTIKYVHNITSLPYTFIFLDIVWCFIVYGATYNDYRIFEFYDIGHNLRKTYMTRRKYNRVTNYLVDRSIINVLEDKHLFLMRFKDYIRDDVSNINVMSFKGFEDYAKENNSFIVRSNSKSFISSYKKYDLSNFRSASYMSEAIKNDKLNLIEKNFNQHKDLSNISDFVIINVLTVYNRGVDIVASTIKYRNENNKIISGFINYNKGEIVGRFKDPDGHTYGENFEGFVIPCYDKILELSRKLCSELEEIRQVEWSFVVTSRGGVYLVDANVWNDYVFIQTPEFLRNKEGLMTYYNRVI